jgi:hypothetical protein
MTATRRITMFSWMTADGYFTAADGNLDWVVPDDEQTKAAVQSMPNSDTLLLGRKTYEMFAAFWPHALDDSGMSPDPHHPGKRSADQISSDRVVLAAPRGHKLARARRVRLRDLHAEPFIWIPRSVSPGYYDAISEALRRAGVELNVVQGRDTSPRCSVSCREVWGCRSSWQRRGAGDRPTSCSAQSPI